MSGVTCHALFVTYHMSVVTCLMSQRQQPQPPPPSPCCSPCYFPQYAQRVLLLLFLTYYYFSANNFFINNWFDSCLSKIGVVLRLFTFFLVKISFLVIRTLLTFGLTVQTYSPLRFGNFIKSLNTFTKCWKTKTLTVLAVLTINWLRQTSTLTQRWCSMHLIYYYNKHCKKAKRFLKKIVSVVKVPFFCCCYFWFQVEVLSSVLICVVEFCHNWSFWVFFYNSFFVAI